MYMNSARLVFNLPIDVYEKHTLNAILDVVGILKAFQCDLFGSFVCNWRVLGVMKNEEITFRVDSHLLQTLMSAQISHLQLYHM